MAPKEVKKLKSIAARMLHFDLVERGLRKFFYVYGGFVGRNPFPFIVIPVLFTLACSVGFLKKNNVVDAVYLYTPNSAPSRSEREVVNKIFPMTNGNYDPQKAITDKRQCSITVTAKDGGNMLRKEYADEANMLNRLIMNINVTTPPDNNYTFTDLCLLQSTGDCYRNAAVNFVTTVYQKLPGELTFPMVYFGSQSVYIASGLGGVTLRNGSDVVESAESYLMVYQLQFFPENISSLSGMWEKEFQYFMGNYTSRLLKVTYFTSQTLNEELGRNAEEITPKFVVTFTVLIAFSIFSSSSLISGTAYTDWVVSKPMLALSGVINAGMGVASSIGLMSLCGYIYNDIVSVMPILIVSICVEYMFLMTGAWRKTNRTFSVEVRMSECISESSVSIFIAMFTGAISFAVGTITAIPAVQIFSAYACVAMMFSLLFQFTFFVGMLSLYGRLEAQDRHCLFFMVATNADTKDSVGFFRRVFTLGTFPDKDFIDSRKNFTSAAMDRFARDYYAPTLMHPVTKGVVIAVLLGYLAVGLYGCLQLKEGLKPENLLVSNSYAIPHYVNMEKYFWSYGPQMQVVVQQAMDLNTHEGRLKALEIVQAFANTSHTIGLNGVQFFLPDYLSYLRHFNYSKAIEDKPELFVKHLKYGFLGLNTYAQWREDVVFGNPDLGEDPEVIKSFRFLVGMKNFSTSNDQRDTLLLMRQIAGRFKDNKLITFMYMWLFADQYLVILPNTLENIAIALALMVIVSVVLIPQPLAALSVAFAIGSIDIGVIGYMTLWGVNLDAISMITIIMSIGFSVDFTAHISYGYVVSAEKDPVKRMRQVLGDRWWPIIQGGTSTIFGMLALANVDSYLVVTFFKTVFLVMLIGVIHAIVFLPVLLSLLIRPESCCCCKGEDDEAEAIPDVLPFHSSLNRPDSRASGKPLETSRLSHFTNGSIHSNSSRRLAVYQLPPNCTTVDLTSGNLPPLTQISQVGIVVADDLHTSWNAVGSVRQLKDTVSPTHSTPLRSAIRSPSRSSMISSPIGFDPSGMERQRFEQSRQSTTGNRPQRP